MSNVLTTLDFESRRIRMRVDEDGNPWWVARDVCDALGIQNATDTLAKCIDEDEKGVDTVYTPGGAQQMATINEAGLYSLILRSRKPEAKKFKRWITHEVIPSVRKHGFYVRPGVDPVIALMDALKERRIAELELARKQAALEARLLESERLAHAALDVQVSNFGHYTVLAWCRLHGLDLVLDDAARHGRRLTNLCQLRGCRMGRVTDPRFGRVNTYPEELLREYFGMQTQGGVA